MNLFTCKLVVLLILTSTIPAAASSGDYATAAIARVIATGQPQDTEADPISEFTLIDNVHVIDVNSGEVLEEQRVLLRVAEIDSIGPRSEIAVPESATVVDADGKFLMPGLFDAHVHMSMSMPSFSKLMVAHGVTATRDTGAATALIINARGNSQDPSQVMPELFVTGAIVDGDPPVWPFSEVCTNGEEARAAVKKLHEAGVNQIKVYARLPEDAYRAAIEEAHRLELKATGHVADSVDLDIALETGQDCIEHLDGFDRLILSIAEGEDSASGNMFERMRAWDLVDEIDQDKLNTHLQRHAEQGVFHCPTLVVMEGIGRVADPDNPGVEDPRMKYVHVFVANFWNRGYERFSPLARNALPSMEKLVFKMHENGVPLVIGTDLANPFVFAGSSVHDEMVRFESAGIPAADVLRMATINAATLCNADDRLGSIEHGKSASLVLLNANPLEDIGNVRDIESVWCKGVLYDRRALDEMLKSLEVNN
ncbi:MAG: amidohydrolase family protein [Planctomycetota bacterium]